LFDTGLGWMGIVGSLHGLRDVILPRESKEAVLSQVKRRDYSVETCDSCSFGDLPQRLRHYFAGELVHFPDKVDFDRASRFQQSVWQVARSIPYGETRSYGWVAAQMGLPKAARAVGQALGRNPLPIVIPCHRVISSNGGLGGFSAGLEMKRYFLNLEKAGIR
jgi:methylated-DNA-[protein]-cysteine S-methyltransferase